MGTVLVVDDDVTVRQLVSAVLARDGLTVESVEDGASALARLAERDYALVLTDMTMPGMSGLKLLRTAEERGHAVPFLVMSAYLDPVAEQVLCTDPGVAGVIRKPFEIARLVTDVRAVLDRSPTQQAVPERALLPLVPLELFVLVAERLRPRRLAPMSAGRRAQAAPSRAARGDAAGGRRTPAALPTPERARGMRASEQSGSGPC